MTVLLILTILILTGIALWQITKIFELSQPKKENTQVADDDDNRWNGQLMFAFLIFIHYFYYCIFPFFIQNLNPKRFTIC